VIDNQLISIKERVNIAREIDRLELMYRRKNTDKIWLQKAKEDIDILSDDNDDDE
jgi:ATP-dependent RNA helicase DDX24/MAK5